MNVNSDYWFEFNDSCIEDLESCLDQGPIIEFNGRELRQLLEEEIDRIGKLKVIIYSSEHPPPHFHVKYDGEENSFSISACSPLYPNGGLKQYFRNIKKWHSNNRTNLISAWNRLRPSDCPVGPIEIT